MQLDVGMIKLSDYNVSDYKVRWTLPAFFSWSWEEGYQSPRFVFENACWFLQIKLGASYPEEHDGWVSLRLYKAAYTAQAAHYASYTLGIENKCGKNYMNHIVKDFRIEEGYINFFERSKFQEDRYNIEQYNELTIFCIMRFVKKAVQPLAKVEKISQIYKTLPLSEEDSDVVLKVMGREFRAHRQILSAQSPVFEGMFKHDMVEKRSGIVEITDCDPDCFKDFFLYLHSGKVDMTTDNVLGLYVTSDKYIVDDLRKECVQFMIRELAEDTFFDLVITALWHNDSALLEACTKFFTNNTKNIILTVEWTTFLRENPDEGNELYIKAYDIHCLD